MTTDRNSRISTRLAAVSPGGLSHRMRGNLANSIRLEEAGILPRWWGENVGLSVRPAEEAVEDALARWLSDAPHRCNILHPQYTYIGVGVGQTPEGWDVFVVELIKP